MKTTPVTNLVLLKYTIFIPLA